jgi:hypothetical protein
VVIGIDRASLAIAGGFIVDVVLFAGWLTIAIVEQHEHQVSSAVARHSAMDRAAAQRRRWHRSAVVNVGFLVWSLGLVGAMR